MARPSFDQSPVHRQGWERIARVREKSSNVNIYVRHSEPCIDGLVILVVDREGGDVVFANIAGRIDLARFGELGQVVSLPGLDSLDQSGDKHKSSRAAKAEAQGDKDDDSD